MKIKITGCGLDSYWYKDKIGEVFEVGEEVGGDYYSVVGNDVFYGWIKKTDCIPYKEEPKEEPEGSEYIHIADGLEDEKPEPESVEDVLKRMPNPKNYQDPISGVINLRGYYKVMKSCFKDFKAAQEMEGV